MQPPFVWGCGDMCALHESFTLAQQQLSGMPGHENKRGCSGQVMPFREDKWLKLSPADRFWTPGCKLRSAAAC